MKKSSLFQRKGFLNIRGELMSLEYPKVMGILNITENSFYDGGKHPNLVTQLRHVEKLVSEGADMVDIGAQSSKPGAKEQGILHEKQVLIPLLKSIKQTFPQTIISIDTWHAEIARVAAGEGADIINDISGGTFDNQMFATMAQLQLPYILMHTNGKPDIMQANPQYDNVLKEVIYFMSEQISKLNALGVNDIIVDPGFGFGKNLDHNYQLLSQLNHFSFLETPVLVGISRKSMINKVINTSPDEALNGTSVLHTLALEQGAQILRVHDVKEAKQCIQLFKKNKNSI